MKLILMRHGESIGNTKHGFISGRTDPSGLTTNGRAQVTRSAWELKDDVIDHIYASPVVRAQETAAILHSFLHKEVETLDWLTELNHGIFEGYYWWEVIHKISPSWRRARTQFDTAFPEGESMELLIQRIWKGLQQLISIHQEHETILLVSHQAPITGIRYVLEKGNPVHLTGAPKQEEFITYMNTVQLPNAGFAEVVLEGKALQSIKEHTSFDHVNPSSTTMLFYMKGVAEMKAETTAQPMETASNNIVYKVTDDKQYIVKVLENTDTAAAKRQVKVYEYLNTKGISVPHIAYFDTSMAFFNADVLVQDFVEGYESKECIQDHTVQCGTFLKDIFVVLTKIHELPSKEVESFWRPPVEKPFLSWKNFMHYNINLTLHSLQDFELSTSAKEQLSTELSSLRAYILERTVPEVPIHSDPGSGNFIIGHENGICRLKRIIDFEWARMGDPLWDFAYYWGWLERDNFVVSQEWKKILTENIPHDMARLQQFRLLFHAWTVRDMLDYKDKPIRLRRGKKSLELLS